MTKKEIQDREFYELRNYHQVALKWATGVGKTRECCLLLWNARKVLNKRPKVFLVVAERSHKKNWADELAKWMPRWKEEYDFTIECYASLHKYYSTEWDIVICDEAHHGGSKTRVPVFETMKTKYVFLLSATLPQAVLSEYSRVFGSFKVSLVRLRDAIDDNILPDPKVWILQLTLDNKEMNEEIVITNKTYTDNAQPIIGDYKKRWNYYSNNKYPYVKIPCTQKQKYDWLTEVYEHWRREYVDNGFVWQDNYMKQAGIQRKRYMGELKDPYAKKVLKRIKQRKKRFICFCTSVAQCDRLGNNRCSIHSKKRKCQDIIDNFNSKKIDQLYAVGMTTEGTNLTDIQAGVIVQLDGKERLFVQKYGRAMRAQYPEQYIFYFKGTQDERYLGNALKNIDEKFIQYVPMEVMVENKTSKPKKRK